MRTIILMSCVLITTLCNAQKDFVKQAELSLEARRAYNDNNYEKALELYEQLFTINDDHLPVEYLKAANTAAQLKDNNRCVKWIKESIIQKKTEKATIQDFSENPLYQKCADSILSDYTTYRSKYYKNLKNPMLYFEIQELINRDQVVRKLKDYYFGITEEDTEKAFNGLLKAQEANDKEAQQKYWAIISPKMTDENNEFYRKTMLYADSLNVVKLIDLTKEYGWQQNAHIILWHQRGNYGKDNWVWNFFKPYIDNEIKKGTIAPYFWAVFEDFASNIKTGETIYGYYSGKVNPTAVNEKRKSIGLPILTLAEIEARNNRTDKGSMF